MKTLKSLLGCLFCVALVVLGVDLLLSAHFVPERASSSNILTYAAVLLIAGSAYTIVTGLSRLNVLMTAKQTGCSALFGRKFESFKEYCQSQMKDGSYIQRLLIYIFTFLVIAALVVKGSVAVAVLLTVAFAVSSGIKGFMRKVANGSIQSGDVFKATV